jgi:hypothetical protein
MTYVDESAADEDALERQPKQKHFAAIYRVRLNGGQTVQVARAAVVEGQVLDILHHLGVTIGTSFPTHAAAEKAVVKAWQERQED